MKDEISQILNHLNGDEEVSRIRNWLLTIDSSDIQSMAAAIGRLSDAIQRTNLHSHEVVGIYRFFLACLYFEMNEYHSAIPRLQIALQEVWGNPVNKSLVLWLLGLCHSNVGEYPEARRFLQDGIQILITNSHHYSQQSDRERRMRQSAEQEIRETLNRMFNEPLFRSVRPDPVTSQHFPLQESSEEEEKGISISLNFPISVNNQNNPVNKINFASQGTNQTKDQNTGSDISVDLIDAHDTYESRTDHTGYMILPSQPVYYQKAKAGKSGMPRLEPEPNNFVEVLEIRINGKYYDLHPIRSGLKINPESSIEWGWMKIKGDSMNAMKSSVSIENDDYVLIRFGQEARENDIVITALMNHKNSEEQVTVKRFKGSAGRLVSESKSKGPEYDPIIINKQNDLHIIGIVYAVAKPVAK